MFDHTASRLLRNSYGLVHSLRCTYDRLIIFTRYQHKKLIIFIVQENNHAKMEYTFILRIDRFPPSTIFKCIMKYP